jgi:stalled ribosome alternative rescue factor ArfA
MTKFSDKHMAASPVKQIAKDRVGRLRARAQSRSERSGETGGYDYEDPKVLKLLNKASRIEKRNKILDSGFVKGGKNKGSIYGEDPRIGESYERPDVDNRSGINYGSPLKGAYAAGGGGGKYKSILPHIQQLNAAVSNNVRQILEDRQDPEKEAQRLQNRVDRRNQRQVKKGKGSYDEQGNYSSTEASEFEKKTSEIIARQKNKQTQADKKQKDPCFDEKTGKMKNPGTTAINSRGRIEYC